MRAPEVLAPLRHRDFRLLWTGQTVSSFGNSVYTIALPFQLLALGASPVQLGIAAGINTAANVALLLLGGAVADRVPRRALILASDLSGCVVAGSLAVASAAGQLRIEHVYAASAALGASEAILWPAYNAIVVDLVPREILRAGNAARLLGRSGARILGPTVGGLVVGSAGPASAFGLDALTFAFSFGALLLASPPARAPRPSAPMLGEIRDGFAHVFARPWLWSTIVYFMLVNVAYAGQSSVMTPLLVRDRLGGGAPTFGAISSAYGVGTIAASVVVAQLAVRGGPRLLFGFEILAGAATLAIGLVPALPGVVAAMALEGVGLASSTVVWQTTLQRELPERMLGRVSSIDLLGNALINPLAPIAGAALVASVGAAGSFAVAGVYAVALASLGLIASPLGRARPQ